MSIENTIIASVIHERGRMAQSSGPESLDEPRQINKYGRRMIRLAEAKKINRDQSNEEIAAAITPVLAFLFWQIAQDLLLWIVEAIRRRIWQQEPQQ